ncbi:MAG: ATP-dependent RNA helicase HrpA [Planctomycetota bacterium]
MSSDDPPLRIDDAMLVDQRPLRRLRQSIKQAKRRGKPSDRNERRFDELIKASTLRRAERERSRPKIDFDLDLPVLAKADEIRAAIAEHPVTVLCGETGSGKSTQLPKLCLDAGRGVAALIGHTQPRRVAARSVAARIAQEIGTPLGRHVGYKVRFQDETAADTYIKLMTDGVLLAEAQSDRRLDQYDTIILDEAHERSLNIDLLLGLMRTLVERRPELRVVITSATIDADRFAEFFARGQRPAPIIEASGRSYPVEVRYEEPDKAIDPLRAVVDAVQGVQSEHAGDTLVFLPTERDIRETAKLLRGAGGGFEIAPLYARLSAAEQQRVFEPGKRRRVVLATNVAESSVTVPGIRSVVDTGLARIARYSPRSRVQRLPIEPVSQASANQRAGRCGRLGPGVCVRLYAESDYDKRREYTTPEIRRTDLAAVVLRMLTLGLGEIDEFPLLDRPKPETVRGAYATLRELQAVDESNALTDVGRTLGRMPVDPRVGRMILAAADEECLAEVLIIAAALETQDPRLRPAERAEDADRLHKRFADGRSDFIAYLSLWDHLEEMRRSLTRSAFRRECERQHLSLVRVWEWRDVHRQLRDAARQSGLKAGERTDGYGAIHRALLAGLLSGVALRRGDEGYQSAGGEGFQLWPGSGVSGSKPKWVVAAEVVETHRRYLRTVARIRPEWLGRLADHVAERTYRPPQWSDDEQTVVAQERRSLYGLPISGRRTVKYGPIDAAASREVFLQEALVGERLRGAWSFLEHNREVVQRLKVEGAKTRSPHELIADGALLTFYDERLPADVYDARGFRRWRGRDRGGDDPLMLADPAESQGFDTADANNFPDELEVSGNRLAITYVHDRSRDDDGATLHVPEPLVPVLDASRLEWLVPGLLEAKVAALIKTLPKDLRTRLVPAPDTARRITPRLAFGEGPFLSVLAEALGEEAGLRIATTDLRPADIPQNLRFFVRVVDADGECVAEGRDVRALQSSPETPEAAEQVEQPAARAPIGRLVADDAWDRPITPDDEWRLTDRVEVVRDGFTIVAFPGLLADTDGVCQRLFVDAGDARRSTARAAEALAFEELEPKLREQVVWLPDWDRLKDALQPLDPRRDLETEVAQLLAARCVAEDPESIRSSEELQETIRFASDRLTGITAETTPLVTRVLNAATDAGAKLGQLESRGGGTASEVRDHLHRLLPPGFFVETPPRWLEHLPRYLKAVSVRVGRVLEGGAAQDARLAERVAPHEQRLDALDPAAIPTSRREELTLYRWMLEEFRVSVFAQQLGASIKVSAKRLDEQWSISVG